MTTAMTDQKVAVDSGQWLLYRYNPERKRPAKIRSSSIRARPSRKVQEDFLEQQTRFQMLTKSKPEDAERLWKLAQKDVESRFRMYEYMASRKIEPAAPAKEVSAKPAAEKLTPAGTTK